MFKDTLKKFFEVPLVIKLCVIALLGAIFAAFSVQISLNNKIDVQIATLQDMSGAHEYIKKYDELEKDLEKLENPKYVGSFYAVVKKDSDYKVSVVDLVSTKSPHRFEVKSKSFNEGYHLHNYDQSKLIAFYDVDKLQKSLISGVKIFALKEYFVERLDAMSVKTKDQSRIEFFKILNSSLDNSKFDWGSYGYTSFYLEKFHTIFDGKL